jgi:hypothetical protein
VFSPACRLGFQKETTPEPAIPPENTNMNAQSNSLEDNQKPADSSDLQIVITEAQLTTLLFSQLERAAGDAVSGLKISLREGKIEAAGRLNQEGLSLPVKVVVEVAADAAGSPILKVSSANAGIFPVPGGMVTEIEAAINEAFQDELEIMAPNLHIDSIVISDGAMTISGRKN